MEVLKVKGGEGLEWGLGSNGGVVGFLSHHPYMPTTLDGLLLIQKN